ncbi:MAG: cysteine protease [Xanthobacteraceae bacterium]|nr:MAG: cysteine protease [Xanthobacteraceae bacterium]
MIFNNPGGAPELACESCGCRWFDRQTNTCYECGTPVPQAEMDAYLKALQDFHAAKGIVVNAPRGRGE